jgi:hypothetical protein
MGPYGPRDFGGTNHCSPSPLDQPSAYGSYGSTWAAFASISLIRQYVYLQNVGCFQKMFRLCLDLSLLKSRSEAIGGQLSSGAFAQNKKYLIFLERHRVMIMSWFSMLFVIDL